MSKANELLTEETRNHIHRVNGIAFVLDRAVDSFTAGARLVITEFGKEIDPLHLPADQYEAVVQASGLARLLRVADSMAERLASLALAA